MPERLALGRGRLENQFKVFHLLPISYRSIPSNQQELLRMSFVQVTDIEWGLSNKPTLSTVLLRREEVYCVSHWKRDRQEVELIFGRDDDGKRADRVVVQGDLHEVARAIGGLFRAEKFNPSSGYPPIEMYLRESAIQAVIPVYPKLVRVVMRSGKAVLLKDADVSWFSEIANGTSTAKPLL